MRRIVDSPRDSLLHARSRWLRADLPTRLALFLCLFALSAFPIAILSILPLNVSFEDFLGVLFHLPPVYWIGLASVTSASLLAFYRPIGGRQVFLLLLLVLGLYLVAGPALAEPNLRSWMSPGAQALLAAGSVDINSPWPYAFYRPWPAVNFLLGSLALSTGISDTMTIAKYGPLLTLPMFVLTSFSIGRRLSLSPERSFAASFFLLATIWMPWAFNINSAFTGYLTHLTLMLLLVTLRANRRHALKSHAIAAMVFTQLLITHFLTSCVVLLAYLLALTRGRARLALPLIMLLLFGAWYALASRTMFAIVTLAVRDQIVNFDPLFIFKTTKLSPGSDVAKFVNLFRLSYVLVVVLPGVSAVASLAAKLRARESFSEAVTLAPCLLFPASLVGLISVSAEFYERAYLYALAPLTWLIFAVVKNPRVLLVPMVLAVGLYVPANYGSESTWMTYDSELSGSKFLAAKTSPRQVYYDFAYYAWYYNPSFAQVPAVGYDHWSSRLPLDRLGTSDYIVDSRLQRNTLRYYYGGDFVGTWIQERVHWTMSRLYDSGYFRVYQAESLSST